MKTKYYISLIGIFIALRFLVDFLFEGFGFYNIDDLGSILRRGFLGSISTWCIALGVTTLIRTKVRELTIEIDFDEEDEKSEEELQQEETDCKAYNALGLVALIIGLVLIVLRIIIY